MKTLMAVLFILMGGTPLAWGITINPPLAGDANPFTLTDARNFFQALHNESENDPVDPHWHKKFSSSSGTWENWYHVYNEYSGGPPHTRAISERVLAYIQASRVHSAQSIYGTRATQGLDYLVSIQKTSDWRFETEDGDDGATLSDAFDTADAAETLAEGYKAFGTQTYRDRAVNAANWLITNTLTQSYRDGADSCCYYSSQISDTPLAQAICFENENFVGSMARALAAVYEITGTAQYRDKAVEASRHLVRHQQADSSWIYYGGQGYSDPPESRFIK